MDKAALVLRDASWFLVRQLPVLLVHLSAPGNLAKSAGSGSLANRAASSPKGGVRKISSCRVLCFLPFVELIFVFPKKLAASAPVIRFALIVLVLTSFAYVVGWLYRQGLRRR
jgi:hypothetical protein